MSSCAAVYERISRAKHVLLFTHVQPDGDAIGSMLAVGRLLDRLGVPHTMVCQDPVPQNLRLLPGWEAVKQPDKVDASQFDLAFSIDASDLERLGTAGALFLAIEERIVVDHHATNTHFGTLNWVDSDVAASGMLAYRLFDCGDQVLNRDDAICLYVAISTDTGNFVFPSVTDETFTQMAALMRAGLPLSQVARKMHLVQERAHVQLLARALSSLSFHANGRVSQMILTQADFAASGATGEHADKIVNHGLNIEGVEACFLATEQKDGHVKLSLRCLPPHDVAQLASLLGGGGHVLASGATIDGPLNHAVDRVRQAMMAMVQGDDERLH